MRDQNQGDNSFIKKYFQTQQGEISIFTNVFMQHTPQLEPIWGNISLGMPYSDWALTVSKKCQKKKNLILKYLSASRVQRAIHNHNDSLIDEISRHCRCYPSLRLFSIRSCFLKNSKNWMNWKNLKSLSLHIFHRWCLRWHSSSSWSSSCCSLQILRLKLNWNFLNCLSLMILHSWCQPEIVPMSLIERMILQLGNNLLHHKFHKQWEQAQGLEQAWGQGQGLLQLNCLPQIRIRIRKQPQQSLRELILTQ